MALSTIAEQQFEEIDTAEYCTSLPSTVSIENFHPTPVEKQSLSLLEEDIFRCMLLKYAKPLTDKNLPGIPSLLNCINYQTSDREVGRVVYVQILSEKADTKASLTKVLGQVYKTFVAQYGQKWVIVVGDAKTYDLLNQSIRLEYGSHLKWLIPMPGDWHILFNYQKALMKAYSDAGLVQLAGASGHRAETLTSLIQCSNFCQTHNFLLSTFEALYRVFVSWYVCKHAESDPDYLGDIKSLLVSLITKLTEVSTDEELQAFRSIVHERFLTEPHVAGAFEDFTHFMEDLAKRQDTIRFWYQFVMKDCFAYLSLFIGIRYRNWMLWTSGIKSMAAVFSAFDCPIYQ